MNRITRRVAPSRRALLVAVAALSVLAVAATTAEAKVVKVTGGQAALTPSSELTQALSSHGVTTAAIAPATLGSDGVLTMPVIGGRVARSHRYGHLALGGGVKFSKGTHSLALRRMAAVHRAKRSFLTANVRSKRRVIVRGHRRVIVRGTRMVIARFTHVTKSISGNPATLSANVVLSARAAALINALAHHHVVSRGAPLGTANATVTLG
jgi:hypothetical protein